MELSFSGTKTLTKLKSVETIKAQYVEEDWLTIEKLYSKITTEASKDLDKLVSSFEKDLNLIINN